MLQRQKNRLKTLLILLLMIPWSTVVLWFAISYFIPRFPRDLLILTLGTTSGYLLSICVIEFRIVWLNKQDTWMQTDLIQKVRLLAPHQVVILFEWIILVWGGMLAGQWFVGGVIAIMVGLTLLLVSHKRIEHRVRRLGVVPLSVER